MNDTPTPQAGRIFISYRRADSAGYAGRIYDRLAAHFGKESIFMDVDTIQAGLDFVEVLENAVQSCDVVVALLGRQWLNIKDETGKRRLDNPQDFVRIEIAVALNRGIRVIPVLVDGTPIPSSNQLPKDLELLARRNAAQVNHHSFHNDVNRLIEQLELALKAAEDSKILKAKKLKEEEVRKKRLEEIENLLSQADIAIDLQDWELAKEKLEAALTLEPDHAQAQIKSAIVERKRRETEERKLAAEKVKQESAQKTDRERKELERLEQKEKDRRHKDRERKEAEEKARQTALRKERQQESIESLKNFFSRMGIRSIIIAGGVVLLFILGYINKGIGNSAKPEPTQIPTNTNLATEVTPSITQSPPSTQTVIAPPFQDGTELKILQWSHFVPQYDVWFDPFAKTWGDANNVRVTVDHININELPAALTAAIDGGDGPSLIELTFAPSEYFEGLHDLTELNMQARDLFGDQAETSKMSSYLPATGTYYGYSPGWVPDPGNYDVQLWSEVGYSNGPPSWEDLLYGGAEARDQLGIPLGLGLSPELDSKLAMRNVIWSFGGSVQDENECVVINSPETLDAVNFLVALYISTMTDEVFAWNSASNNQGLIGGELSYILNAISPYRYLQEIDPEAADNIGFGPALIGPNGHQYSSAHVWSVYVIPNYVEGEELEAAKLFLLHLTENYSQAVYNSKLYNFPAFPSTVPELEGWLNNDPFGSRPADKLAVLENASDWTTWLGYPGPANPAIEEVFDTNIVVTMMAKAARGELTPEEAIVEAEAQINAIFDKWRAAGLVGCN